MAFSLSLGCLQLPALALILSLFDTGSPHVIPLHPILPQIQSFQVFPSFDRGGPPNEGLEGPSL